MAIKAYVGRMGSGKSYEVVSNVIVPALGRGRRVISNIAGLQFDVIKQYLIEQGTPENQIGQLLSVGHDVITDPIFWMTDKDNPNERDELHIRPGDLVCLDEIWRFFEGFRKPPERVLNFVRMHRHMLDDNGVSSDLALVTQDIMDIGPPVRRVIEETFRMTKLTMVGQAKKYRIDVYSGAQAREEKPLRSFFRSYDKKFFPMYSSHSLKQEGQSAKEENIDDRGNILKHPGIKYGVPVGAVLLVASIWFGVSSFSKMWGGSDTVENTESDSLGSGNPTPQNPGTVPDIPRPLKSGNIRAFVSGPSGVVVVTDSEILANPPSLKITPLTVETFSPSGQLFVTEVRKNENSESGFLASAAGSTGGTK